MAERKLHPQGCQIFAKSNQLLARWGFMNAVDNWRSLVLERLGRCDIGRDHKVFDHAVRIEAFTHGNLFDLARIIEHDAPFGQFEIERITRRARFRKRFPGLPQLREMLGRRTTIHRRLRLFIGMIVRDLHKRAREAEIADPALGRDMHMARHGSARLPLFQRADFGRQHFGQHRHNAVREIDRIAALSRFLVDRAPRAHII